MLGGLVTKPDLTAFKAAADIEVTWCFPRPSSRGNLTNWVIAVNRLSRASLSAAL